MKKNYELFIWVGFIIASLIIAIYAIFDINSSLFNIILNLSYSYFAATLFYVVQVAIPEKKKTKNSLRILQEDLFLIFDIIDHFEKYLTLIINFKDDDYIEIQDYNEIIYFEEICNGKPKTKTCNNYREYILSFKDLLLKRINNIKGNYWFNYLPDELIFIIVNMEKIKFYNFESIANFYPAISKFKELKSSIADLSKIVEDGKKYLDKSPRNVLSLIKGKELDDYKKILEYFKPIKESISNRKPISDFEITG